MPRYRKKPVVVEAMEYIVPTCRAVHEWMGLEHSPDIDEDCSVGIVIPTLEGHLCASLGDWIIRGVQGEFYPCKPDIFNATYELAEEEEEGLFGEYLAALARHQSEQQLPGQVDIFQAIEEAEAAMVYVKGKRFVCECGCSVFTRVGNVYNCNGCKCVYEGIKIEEAGA